MTTQYNGGEVYRKREGVKIIPKASGYHWMRGPAIPYPPSKDGMRGY